MNNVKKDVENYRQIFPEKGVFGIFNPEM